jgi:hypothetical protein
LPARRPQGNNSSDSGFFSPCEGDVYAPSDQAGSFVMSLEPTPSATPLPGAHPDLDVAQRRTAASTAALPSPAQLRVPAPAPTPTPVALDFSRRPSGLTAVSTVPTAAGGASSAAPAHAPASAAGSGGVFEPSTPSGDAPQLALPPPAGAGQARRGSSLIYGDSETNRHLLDLAAAAAAAASSDAAIGAGGLLAAAGVAPGGGGGVGEGVEGADGGGYFSTQLGVPQAGGGAAASGPPTGSGLASGGPTGSGFAVTSGPTGSFTVTGGRTSGAATGTVSGGRSGALAAPGPDVGPSSWPELGHARESARDGSSTLGPYRSRGRRERLAAQTGEAQTWVSRAGGSGWGVGRAALQALSLAGPVARDLQRTADPPASACCLFPLSPRDPSSWSSTAQR